jgi:hypothetical protein
LILRIPDNGVACNEVINYSSKNMVTLNVTVTLPFSGTATRATTSQQLSVHNSFDAPAMSINKWGSLFSPTHILFEFIVGLKIMPGFIPLTRLGSRSLNRGIFNLLPFLVSSKFANVG